MISESTEGAERTISWNSLLVVTAGIFGTEVEVDADKI
jgi:hypothetical protein